MAVVLSVVGKFNDKDIKKAERSLNDLKKQAGMGVSPMQKLGASFKSAGKSMESFGKTMTTKVTLPLVAVGYGLKKAVDAASDLAETQSKVGQIFGQSAGEIEKFASTAAQSLGQSKQQAMDAASTFAIFGKSAGLSGSNLVGFSTKLTTLAGDLASFNNTSPEDAITAISAALRGESEPIRRYGVLLDDASLRQEALRQGLIKTTKQALTPQQRVLAAQALIMKQTVTAQGDFARTSGGLANQQRILKAELANTTAELGAAFLPIALDVAKTFQERVLPAIQKVVEWFKQLSPGIKQVILIAGVVVAALGPVIAVIGTLTTAIGFLISPIGLIVVGIAALAAGLIYAYTHFEGFRNVVDTTFKVVKNTAVAVFGWFKNNWKTIGFIIAAPVMFAVNAVMKHWDQIKGIFAGAVQVIRGIVQVFSGLFTGDWSRMWEGIKNIFAGAGKFISNAVHLLVGSIIDWFKAVPGKMLDIGKNIVEGIWNGITGAGSWFMDKVKSWVNDHIPGWMKKVLGISSPSRVMMEVGHNVAAGVAVGIDNGKGLVNKAMRALKDEMLYPVQRGLSKGKLGQLDKWEKDQEETAQRFAKIVPKATDDAFTGMTSGVDKASEAFQKLKDAAGSALDKIKSKAQTVIDFAKNISSSLMDFGAVTSFDTSTPRGVTAGGIIANMTARVNAIKNFGAQLNQLKKLGLNNTSLQEIISAGPEAGSQIAAALIAAGQDAITGPGGVNALENQLRFFSNAVGSFGAESQYGMSTRTAQGVMGTSVTVSPGAVVIHVGDNVDAATIRSLEASIKTEVRNAVKDLGVAITTSKKSSRSK